MRTGATGIFGIITLVVFAAIAADILRNPQGFAAATTGTKGLLATSYDAAAGYKV
jgi:hypothetical protein